jgi:hypothetical protein
MATPVTIISQFTPLQSSSNCVIYSNTCIAWARTSAADSPVHMSQFMSHGCWRGCIYRVLRGITRVPYPRSIVYRTL